MQNLIRFELIITLTEFTSNNYAIEIVSRSSRPELQV